METAKGVQSKEEQNETELSNFTEPLFNKVCEIANKNITTQDDLKIKVEIELKEEENGLIYQPDLYGHLRLVSLNQNIQNNYDTHENEQTGNTRTLVINHESYNLIKRVLFTSFISSFLAFGSDCWNQHVLESAESSRSRSN